VFLNILIVIFIQAFTGIIDKLYFQIDELIGFLIILRRFSHKRENIEKLDKKLKNLQD
jgi:hypothetical protein